MESLIIVFNVQLVLSAQAEPLLPQPHSQFSVSFAAFSTMSNKGPPKKKRFRSVSNQNLGYMQDELKISGRPVGWDIDLEHSSDQRARCMGDVRQGKGEAVNWRALRSV